MSWRNFFLYCLFTALIIPSGACLADDKDETKLWRGTINMTIEKRHVFSVEVKDKKSEARSSHTRNRLKRLNAVINVVGADFLYGGAVKATGTIQSRFDNRDTRRSKSPDGDWSKTKDTMTGQGQGPIEGSNINLIFAKKSVVDSASVIENEIKKCGLDPECLGRIQQKFMGLLQDKAKSFPIRIVAQVMAPCRGQAKSLSVSTSSEGESEVDGPHTTTLPMCLPMAFEMDGTYTRGPKGDTITATYHKSHKNPYKAIDEKNHPIKTVAECSIHLSNGAPEVRIYARSKDGQKDITDKETEVMVGQRLSLSAHVVSTGLGEEISRTWIIPGRIFDRWQASIEEAELIEIEDFENPTIRFAWADGSESGLTRKISYKVDYGGQELSGEAKFKVYTPKTELKVKVGQNIIFATSNGCEIVPDSPSIKLTGTVTMPQNKLNIYHFVVHFLQKIKSNAWGLERVGSPQYQWRNEVFDWLLDTSYPYAGQSGSNSVTLTMQDTPGGPLSALDAIYIDHRFETYLMFSPPWHPELAVTPMFVPLKKIAWRWKGSAVAKTAYAWPRPSCGQGHSITCNKPPSGYSHRVENTAVHPGWSGYTSGQSKMKLYYQGGVTTNHRQAPPPESGWSCN